jgi:hypothetical protein
MHRLKVYLLRWRSGAWMVNRVYCTGLNTCLNIIETCNTIGMFSPHHICINKGKTIVSLLIDTRKHTLFGEETIQKCGYISSWEAYSAAKNSSNNLAGEPWRLSRGMGAVWVPGGVPCGRDGLRELRSKH